MIKVIFCEKIEDKLFTKMWWCDTCNNVGKRETVYRGHVSGLDKKMWEDGSPVPCKTCGRSAGYSTRGTHPIYRRMDTLEEVTHLSELPGACYVDEDGAWDSVSRTKRFGPDGRALNLILPNGRTWAIDGRANNCTRKDDNVHRCWIRSGSPEDGTLHVDKQGHTCEAGAGSIVSGDYHGFCHGGYLVKC